MNANIFIGNEPEPRSLWDEDFHDRLVRQMNERWSKYEAEQREARRRYLLDKYGAEEE